MVVRVDYGALRVSKPVLANVAHFECIKRWLASGTTADVLEASAILEEVKPLPVLRCIDEFQRCVINNG
jgi:hypothetical protein